MQQPSLQELARVVELGEAAGFVDIAAASPGIAGLHTVEFDGATAIIWPDFAGTFTNQVIGLGLTQPVRRDAIRRIKAMYTDAGVDRFGVCISPAAEPAADIPAWLAEEGIVPVNRQTKMWRTSRDLVHLNTDLEIREVASAEEAEAFAAICVEVFAMEPFAGPFTSNTFGRPGWRLYLAWDGDTPVATGLVFINERTGSAWLGSGATLPPHRRRGAQGALMARRINDAIAAGSEWLFIETVEETPQRPNPSYHNMLRTGFQLAYHRQDYIWRREG